MGNNTFLSFIIITRDTHAQCGASLSVYKINNKVYYCIREINAVKHGICLETSFQPSESIVSSIGRRYTRVVRSTRIYTQS